LINVLGVHASGTIFIATHDYSNCCKTSVNIPEPLFKTIQEIGNYNVIQVIIDDATNCTATNEIIENVHPNMFWTKCLMHALNLLMHDIIKLKYPNYKWIGSLYKKGKRMVKFITNHSASQFVFCNHSKLELLKLVKNGFASYHLTFRQLLKVREALTSMVVSVSWNDLKLRYSSTLMEMKFKG